MKKNLISPFPHPQTPRQSFIKQNYKQQQINVSD